MKNLTENITEFLTGNFKYMIIMLTIAVSASPFLFNPSPIFKAFGDYVLPAIALSNGIFFSFLTIRIVIGAIKEKGSVLKSHMAQLSLEAPFYVFISYIAFSMMTMNMGELIASNDLFVWLSTTNPIF